MEGGKACVIIARCIGGKASYQMIVIQLHFRNPGKIPDILLAEVKHPRRTFDLGPLGHNTVRAIPQIPVHAVTVLRHNSYRGVMGVVIQSVLLCKTEKLWANVNFLGIEIGTLSAGILRIDIVIISGVVPIAGRCEIKGAVVVQPFIRLRE